MTGSEKKRDTDPMFGGLKVGAQPEQDKTSAPDSPDLESVLRGLDRLPTLPYKEGITSTHGEDNARGGAGPHPIPRATPHATVPDALVLVELQRKSDTAVHRDKNAPTAVGHERLSRAPDVLHPVSKVLVALAAAFVVALVVLSALWRARHPSSSSREPSSTPPSAIPSTPSSTPTSPSATEAPLVPSSVPAPASATARSTGASSSPSAGGPPSAPLSSASAPPAVSTTRPSAAPSTPAPSTTPAPSAHLPFIPVD